jgi:LacI family transcriptional regulator
VKDSHVTLQDVARRARVSTSTASRALAGTKVRGNTADKVRKAAVDLGYVPHEGARSLRNVRTMTVGMVFHDLTGAFGIELLSAVSAHLDAQGYSVFVSTAQGHNDRYDKLVHRFLERRVDGLFCVHGNGEGGALDRFIAAGIPVAALLTQQGGYARLPLITISPKEGVQQCIQRLLELKHRNVVVARPQRQPMTLDRFTPAAERAGLQVRIENIDENLFNAAAFLQRVLAGKRPPTAVIANQIEAAYLLEAADRLSIDVPGALSIVGVRARVAVQPGTRLPLSMIHLEPERVGLAAAKLLAEHLADGTPLKNGAMVEIASWRERDTTAGAATGP